MTTPRARALEYSFVSAVAVAVSIFLTWPVAADLTHRIYGLPGDSTGTIGFLWLLDEKIGYPIVGSTHMTLTGAPFGWDFANALNAQWALVFFPGFLATRVFGEIAAYNLLVLSGLALSGVAMYWFVRRLGVSPFVAGWAGFVYILFPWHLEKSQGHVGFVHMEGFPVLLAAVLAWEARPDLKRTLFVGGASAILWTTNGYFGILGGVALFVLLLAVLVRHRARFGFGRAAARCGLALGAALVAPVVLLFLSLLGPTEQSISAARSVGELTTYGARPWEYVLPSYRNPYFGDDVGPWLIAHLHGSNPSETSLYVGWLTILLALGWLVGAWSRRTRLEGGLGLLSFAFPVLIVVSLLFSLPSPIPGTGIETPARVVWQVVPQFRVPARFVVVLITALIPLAALGLEGLRRLLVAKVGAPRAAIAASAALCAVAALISYGELSIEAATTEVGAVPPQYGAVNRAPAGPLVEYPLVRSDQGANSEYLFWQRIHERPLVNGAPIDTFADAAGQALVNPASPETAGSLAALGVSAIVLRPSVYALTGPPEAPRRLGRGYSLLGRFGEVSVWQVTARPAPAVAVYRRGFSHTETPDQKSTSRWMIAPEATVEIFTRRPGTYLVSFQVASYGHSRIVRVVGRNTFELFAVFGPRTVTFPVRLPPGRSEIRLGARPGPEPVPDGRRVTVYMSNWSFGPRRGKGEPLQAFPVDERRRPRLPALPR